MTFSVGLSSNYDYSISYSLEEDMLVEIGPVQMIENCLHSAEKLDEYSLEQQIQNFEKEKIELIIKHLSDQNFDTDIQIQNKCLTILRIIFTIHKDIECLKVAGKILGITINPSQSKQKIFFHISEPKVSYSLLLEYIEDFSAFFALYIDVCPIFSNNLLELQTFLQAPNNYISTLDLRDLGNQVNDAFFKIITTSCYNLNFLKMASKHVTNRSFKTLESLKNLQTLHLTHCSGIKKFPAIPPALKKLKLKNCVNLSDEHRLQLLTTLFSQKRERTTRQGLNLIPGLCIENNHELGKHLVKHLEINEIVTHLEKIKQVVPKIALGYLMVPLINEKLDLLIENINDFPLINLPPEVLKNTNWCRLNNFTLNKFKKIQINEESIELELKDIPDIFLDEFLTFFDSINFKNSDKPCFIDPKYLTLDGKKTDSITIRDGIVLLLGHIENNTPYIGTPKDPAVRKKWYQQLEFKLKSIIPLMKDNPDKSLVANELIRLGMAGHQCGTRWTGESSDISKTLQGSLKVEMKGLDEMIALWLDEYKEGIIQEMVFHFTAITGDAMQPHIFNCIANKMRRQGFPLPSTLEIDLDDPLMKMKDVTETDIQNKLDIYLLPLKLAQFIQNKIHDMLQTNPSNGDLVLIPFIEYAQTKLPITLKKIDKSINNKKLIFGIQKTESLLKQSMMTKAILEQDEKAMEQFRKTDALVFLSIRQGLKIDEEKTKEVSKKRKTAQDIDKEVLDTGKLKKQKTEEQITTYAKFIQTPLRFDMELKKLGHDRANQEIKAEKDKATQDYLTQHKLVDLSMIETDGSLKVSLMGALTLLRHLNYLAKD